MKLKSMISEGKTIPNFESKMAKAANDAVRSYKKFVTDALLGKSMRCTAHGKKTRGWEEVELHNISKVRLGTRMWNEAALYGSIEDYHWKNAVMDSAVDVVCDEGKWTIRPDKPITFI